MNTVELRKVLSSELTAVRSGKSKPERSQAVTALAGKIIASYKVDLDYARITKQKPISPSNGHAKALPAPRKNGKA
jgi:hypothetical protein